MHHGRLTHIINHDIRTQYTQASQNRRTKGYRNYLMEFFLQNILRMLRHEHERRVTGPIMTSRT